MILKILRLHLKENKQFLPKNIRSWDVSVSQAILFTTFLRRERWMMMFTLLFPERIRHRNPLCGHDISYTFAFPHKGFPPVHYLPSMEIEFTSHFARNLKYYLVRIKPQIELINIQNKSLSIRHIFHGGGAKFHRYLKYSIGLKSGVRVGHKVCSVYI